MKLSKFFYACTIWMLASLVQAQDAKELSDIRADNVLRTQQIAAAQASLEKYNGKIQALESDITAAEKVLENAKAEEAKASVAFSSDPTAANKRVVDRANSSLMLAKHKVASLNKRLGFSQTKKTEAENQITSNLGRIAVNKRRQDQLLEEIAIQERAKQGAEERAAEIARKKAAQQEAERQRQALALAEAQKKAAEPKLSAAEQAEVDAARAAVKELDSYLAGDVRARADIRRPILNSSIDGRFELEHLGGEIYMVEAALSAGEHRMSINTKRYRVIIGQADDGELFRIYYDNRNLDKQRLMAFKSSTLK